MTLAQNQGTARSVLAFDIGGSKTHAVRADNGIVTAEVIVGSANVSSVGVDEAGLQLDRAITELGGANGIGAVLAGSAGADTPASVARLTALLTHRVPDAAVRVVHDTQLILAAAGLDEGIALICGTGSVAWGCAGPRTARAGGWGHLLGDEGSGYWVAREAVRSILRDVDNGRPPDQLATRFAAECGVDDVFDLLDHFYTHEDRQYWAQKAGIVFEFAADGDTTSIEIVDTASRALGELVIQVADRLQLRGPVVFAGGQVVHQPALQNGIRTILTTAAITDIRVLERDPVHGAVRLAHQLLTS